MYMPTAGSQRSPENNDDSAELALAGSSYVSTSLSSPGTMLTSESLLPLLFFQSAGQSSFCLLLIDNASYRKLCQTTLQCVSCTSGKIDYPASCDLKSLFLYMYKMIQGSENAEQEHK